MKREQLLKRGEEEKHKECVFTPNIQITKDKKAHDKSETQDFVERLYNPKFLAHIKDKTAEEVEIERNFKELTFHPQTCV